MIYPEEQKLCYENLYLSYEEMKFVIESILMFLVFWDSFNKMYDYFTPKMVKEKIE